MWDTLAHLIKGLDVPTLSNENNDYWPLSCYLFVRWYLGECGVGLQNKLWGGLIPSKDKVTF